ncbi:hypothetical protein ACFX5U_07640 [Sphingobacterium sp. SG20118]|uniref:hypothetical protein n=1 Tax=Sphingobacterium sp. SG20118 TaxID=3367156 RepID=UPI0037DFC216
MNTITTNDRQISTLINLVINQQSGLIDESLLETYIVEALEDDDYTFSSGLLGIGWFIALLDYEKMIQIDIDEILYDFDDNLYKIALKVIVDKNATIEEVTNLITYFHQRFLSKSNLKNNYRRFPIYECLKMLMEKWITLISTYYKIYCRITLAKNLLKMSFVGVKAYENKEGEQVFFNVIEILLIEYSASDKILSEKDIEAIFYLLIAVKQFHNPHWENLIRDVLSRSKHNNRKIMILEQVSQIDSITKEIRLLNIHDETEVNDKEFLSTLLSSIKFVKI